MSDAPRRAFPWKTIVIVVLVVGALAAVSRLPVRPWLEAFNAFVADLGIAGVLVFVVGYAIAALLLPASILTLGAGATFGPWVGTAAVSVASTTSACLAFLIGRTVARGAIERRMASFPRFAAVESAVSREGFKIVLLTRLSPLFPFTWQNYAYGVTTVRFRDYALASWIGMLPGTFAYVYLGHAAKTVTESAASGETGGSMARTIAKVAIVVVPALLVTAYVGRIAKRALNREGAGSPADGHRS